jgi:acetyl esterase/lipase
MVMGRRPGVARSSWAITAIDLVGLAGQLATALVRVPFRDPLAGEGNPVHNTVVALTRETIRSFMGYSSSLPIEEFRSIEVVLDDVCRMVMPPVVHAKGVIAETTQIAGVPGIWYRPKDRTPRGTILYLHGGGYIGTSPRMYASFTSSLCRSTGCQVFVADYRLAPEFPFPAGLEDAVLVLESLAHGGVDPGALFVAGDSGGGGLAATLLYAMETTRHVPIAGVMLFSPEVDLLLDEPSVTENASKDILPWNIPTAAYLHGRSPDAAAVAALGQDVSLWPPVLIASGADEMFRDPIRRFVEHLRDAEVPVIALEEPGMFHVFPILMPWAEASRRVFPAIEAFVDHQLAPAAAGRPKSGSATA